MQTKAMMDNLGCGTKCFSEASACNHFINLEYEMRKIRLNVEDLCVDSFVTDVIQATRGTVNGHRPPNPTEEEGCESGECGGGTDFMECDPTVHYSCYHTCMLIDTCAQASACTNCQGGVTWFCD